VLLRAGFAAERLRHVPNFVPPAAPAAAATADPEQVVFTGRLAPEKGIVTLVHAMSRLRRGRLVICGDGPLRPQLEALARAAAPGRIVLRGHLDAASLAEERAAAAFTAVPSEWFENAPFAVLESLAAGRAALASNLGGLPELVDDGETGRLLPPGDPDAWEAALERAFAAAAEVRRWGDAAAGVAASRWSLAEHVDRVEAAYREVGA
jgi:glycosyltransferase involved in cell wall biosynthesis